MTRHSCDSAMVKGTISVSKRTKCFNRSYTKKTLFMHAHINAFEYKWAYSEEKIAKCRM